MRRRVLYAEKYKPFANIVTTAQAQAIVTDSVAGCWCLEQGTVEIPEFDGQHRQFIVLRLERIVPDAG